MSKNIKPKPIIIQIITAIIIGYILFGLFLFFNQKAMLYYPDAQEFEQCEGFSDYKKITHNGTRFYFKQNSTKKVIIYYHGNAGSACDRSSFRPIFEQSDASILFVEYSGYSNDNKTPSKKLILNDVQQIHDYITQHNFKNIVVYGQSIGSGAASYHASLGDVDKLLLVTPFSNLTYVVQSIYKIYPASLILTEKYPNNTWLKNYQGEILILHGDTDRIIPHEFSQKLYKEISTPHKEYLLIEGKGHNTIWSSPLFQNKIIEYITH
jgi:uncharacterized protein